MIKNVMINNGNSALQNKTALVIGATGGIGFEIALSLHKSDCVVTLHGRDSLKLEQAAKKIHPQGKLNTVCADLSNAKIPESVSNLASLSDIVVIAYGPFVYKTLSQTTHDDWNAMALGCLALPGELASLAAAAMASRGFGRILLFGGTRTDTIRGYKNNAAYAAAKTGLAVITKSIAREFGGSGVSCSMICPGFVDTEYLDESTKLRLAALSPSRRLISRSEIARLSLFLLSEAMDIVNGAVITADQGLFSL